MRLGMARSSLVALATDTKRAMGCEANMIICTVVVSLWLVYLVERGVDVVEDAAFAAVVVEADEEKRQGGENSLTL